MFEKNIRHFSFSDPVKDLIILLIDALAVSLRSSYMGSMCLIIISDMPMCPKCLTRA